MTRKNRAMLIGSIGAGKSTLTNALLERKQKAVKTQSLSYSDWIVDTPGEYTENPFYYKNIMATSLEVTHVLYLQDATRKKTIFPPNFSTGINKLPIGVVTKCDHDQADVEEAVRQLQRVIPSGPIVLTSSFNGRGMQEIRNLVNCDSLGDMREYISTLSGENVFFI
ncbi:50S ribosome-binding GTPase [Rossellomorea vietnamensis]|uniref:50S ribosome-binding GTPase n=1 Tax=Rossellomorea vietnamensis TaxID=218284 RepID=A0ACD4C466_9BACI|nr:EutP/PduV family microcompartment system protein [Rossellomorea vietnamensis]UXH43298.1 50S ribosome-binding GTPase [Rossellomorea vietnamensis]